MKRIDAALVHAVLATIDMEPTAVAFLARGATSHAWRAQTYAGPIVIRFGDTDSHTGARFEADVAVRRRLFQAGGQVAEPLAVGRWETPASGDGAPIPWCVDRLLLGEPAPRGDLPEQVCRETGELLSRLHALPTSRYGLLEDRQDELRGQAPDPVAGLLTRLHDPWPFTSEPLARHPIAAAAPDLVALLAPLEDRLRALIVGGASCLNHTDLHERQILVAGGHLSGLLDFGDAAIGPPAWDIASFAGFHGWSLANVLLASYTADEALRRRLFADARDFGVLIALHHAGRSVELGQPRRMRGAVDFLRSRLTAVMR